MVYNFSASVEHQINVLSELSKSVQTIDRFRLTAHKCWVLRFSAKLKINFSLKMSLRIVHVNLQSNVDIITKTVVNEKDFHTFYPLKIQCALSNRHLVNWL